MAYRDANGNITIDQVAANSDIQKMNQVVEKLSYASKSLQKIIMTTTAMKGQTADAIVEQALKQKKAIDTLISDINADIAVIRKAVNKYQELDRKVAEAVRSTAGGGNGAFGGGSNGTMGGR